MIKIIKNNKFTFILCLLLLSGCSKEVMNEIKRTINANFGNYTKSNPLTIAAMPFKPAEKIDEESQIGKIAWDGAVSGLKDVAWFSNDKVIYKGIIENERQYQNILREDPFWNDFKVGSIRIKNILSRTARSYGVNSLIYGLYDGDDQDIRLSVYFYSKVDDIILKQRTEAHAPYKETKGLVAALKNGNSLSSSQKALKKMIHEKTKVATASLIAKYTEGR